MKPPSAKQMALLTFLNLPIPNTLGEAQEAIAKATENPCCAEALRVWRIERLYLYPDLYADELALFKSRRVELLRSANNNERGPGCPLRVLTSTQVEIVVKWLDTNRPAWDRRLLHEGGEFLNPDFFHDTFIPLTAQLLPECVKRGYENIRDGTIAPVTHTYGGKGLLTHPRHKQVNRNLRTNLQCSGFVLILTSLFCAHALAIPGFILLILGLFISPTIIHTCGACGNSVVATSLLCPTCNTPLFDPEKDSSNRSESRPLLDKGINSQVPTSIAIGIIIAVTAVLVGLWLNWSK